MNSDGGILLPPPLKLPSESLTPYGTGIDHESSEPKNQEKDELPRV